MSYNGSYSTELDIVFNFSSKYEKMLVILECKNFSICNSKDEMNINGNLEEFKHKMVDLQIYWS